MTDLSLSEEESQTPSFDSLGLTPEVPGTPGLLPLELGHVHRVVGFLGVESTTTLAVRVLSTDPASGRA